MVATLASAIFRELALNSQFQIHRSQNWRLCWGLKLKVRCTLGLVHNCVFNCIDLSALNLWVASELHRS